MLPLRTELWGGVVGVPPSTTPDRMHNGQPGAEQLSFPLCQAPPKQVPAFFHGTTGRKSLGFIYLTQIKGLSHVIWDRARI